MSACHAMVQRILLETAGIVSVVPGTTAIGKVLQPPARLDISPMFADDAIIAGEEMEVKRVLIHWQSIMPRLGLRFSRLEAIPAAGQNTLIDVSSFQALGCKVNLSQTAVVMKSPIGGDTFCESVVHKRVNQSLDILHQISCLPNSHIAFLYCVSRSREWNL